MTSAARRRVVTRTALAVCLAGASVAGCGAILGIKEIYPESVDAAADGAGPVDASPRSADGDLDKDREASADGGACDADTTQDPRHCGRCGHDCLGGACRSSRCEAVQIATTAPESSALAVDDAYIYWVDANYDVTRTKKWGDGFDTAAVVGHVNVQSSGLRDLHVEGDSIFWLTSMLDGSILGCEKDGCLIPYPLVHNVRGGILSLWARRLYWLEQSRIASTSVKGPLSPDGGPPVVTIDPVVATRLAIDASGIYYITGDGHGRVTLVANALEGGAPRILADADEFSDLALDSEAVWVTDCFHGAVSRVAKADGRTTVIAQSSGPPNSRCPTQIAVDADYVYWAEVTTQTLWRSATNIAAPEKILSGVVLDNTLHIDERALYFVDGTRVLRLAK